MTQTIRYGDVDREPTKTCSLTKTYMGPYTRVSFSNNISIKLLYSHSINLYLGESFCCDITPAFKSIFKKPQTLEEKQIANEMRF